MVLFSKVNKQPAIIKICTKLKNSSRSRIISNILISKMETDADLKAYKKAVGDYKKNPVSYSHKEVAVILRLVNKT